METKQISPPPPPPAPYASLKMTHTFQFPKLSRRHLLQIKSWRGFSHMWEGGKGLSPQTTDVASSVGYIQSNTFSPGMQPLRWNGNCRLVKYSVSPSVKKIWTHTLLSPRGKSLANLFFLAAVFLLGSVGEEAAADDLVIFTHPHLLSSSSSRFLFLPPPVFTSLPFVSSFFPRV